MNNRNKDETQRDGLQITSMFPSGAGIVFEWRASDYVRFTIPSDVDWCAARGYDYYFSVRVCNRRARPATLTLEARRPGRTQSPVWQPTCVPVFISHDHHNWYVADSVHASPTHEEFLISLMLEPGQCLYLSNSLPYLPEWMQVWIKRVQQQNTRIMKRHVLGQTVQGRDICLVSITDPEIPDSTKDRILVTSGFHPAEPDWLATQSIIEGLLGSDGRARRVRREFIVDVVLQVNPDGYALGTNATNARGVNMYWDFRPQDSDASPEAFHLWNWISNHPPVLYLDLHAYVFQLHKDYRPYLRPTTDYAPDARPMVRTIDKALVRLCAGRRVIGPSTYDPCTPAAQITSQFGTVTYPKFHVHLVHGIEACRELGWQVFLAIVESSMDYRPLRQRIESFAPRKRIRDMPMRWWETGHLPLALRLRWRRLWRPDVYHIRSSMLGASQMNSCLKEHWQSHLWSQRDQVPPAISIGG